MIFKGKTLEEVYEKAVQHFNKSISELNIDVIQHPSKGIFGLFSKDAIVEISEIEKEEQEPSLSADNNKEVVEKRESSKNKVTNKKSEKSEKEEEALVNDIYKIRDEVEKEVNKLFEISCFNIDKIKVKVYDEETLFFLFDGEDSALLIGKEGYRYNALAQLLFNWVSQKYGLKTRLEIGNFLESQEEMMRRFLEPTIREIEETGRVKTKPFDGILAFVAVEILRQEFPHKYVAIKKDRDGSQYVVVNDFYKRKDRER
jgi:spoIIIJ-associated protein